MSVATLAKKDVPDNGDLLADGENPFSTNKVTGHSLNFPIIGTCMPTEVCGSRCYFTRGPSTWTASLRKQHRLMNTVKKGPSWAAGYIAGWAIRLRLSFVRWNGGGDLFRESVDCINEAAPLMAAIPQWVVTRKPALAARIAPADNVFVHLSVDRGSWDRLDAMRQSAPAGLLWFWSYQCDRGEAPTEGLAPVIFRDGYDLAGSEPVADDCLLNLAESIVGVCNTCRRCFSGAAVERAKQCHGNQ
jgi:hypothetical protein